MEATHSFNALMANLGPEPIDDFEDDDGDNPPEDINLTPKAALNDTSRSTSCMFSHSPMEQLHGEPNVKYL